MLSQYSPTSAVWSEPGPGAPILDRISFFVGIDLVPEKRINVLYKYKNPVEKKEWFPATFKKIDKTKTNSGEFWIRVTYDDTPHKNFSVRACKTLLRPMIHFKKSDVVMSRRGEDMEQCKILGVDLDDKTYKIGFIDYTTFKFTNAVTSVAMERIHELASNKELLGQLEREEALQRQKANEERESKCQYKYGKSSVVMVYREASDQCTVEDRLAGKYEIQWQSNKKKEWVDQKDFENRATVYEPSPPNPLVPPASDPSSSAGKYHYKFYRTSVPRIYNRNVNGEDVPCTCFVVKRQFGEYEIQWKADGKFEWVDQKDFEKQNSPATVDDPLPKGANPSPASDPPAPAAVPGLYPPAVEYNYKYEKSSVVLRDYIRNFGGDEVVCQCFVIDRHNGKYLIQWEADDTKVWVDQKDFEKRNSRGTDFEDPSPKSPPPPSSAPPAPVSDESGPPASSVPPPAANGKDKPVRNVEYYYEYDVGSALEFPNQNGLADPYWVHNKSKSSQKKEKVEKPIKREVCFVEATDAGRYKIMFPSDGSVRWVDQGEFEHLASPAAPPRN